MTHAKFETYQLAQQAALRASGLGFGRTPQVVKFSDGKYGAEVVDTGNVYPITTS